MTIEFLLTTLFFIFGTAFFIGVANISIASGQWFDGLFNWQDKLTKWGSTPGVLNTIKYKALGGCSICFAHFLSVFSFGVFVLTTKGEWFSTSSLFTTIIGSIGWYFIYVCSSTVLGVICITKWMAKNEK